MKSFILSRAGRMFFPCLLALSVIVLFRGHNSPGGGFIGGLLAASAFILIGLGETMARARACLYVDPVVLLGIGLGVALLSGLPGLFGEGAFLAGRWLTGIPLPWGGEIRLGTPLLFDLGVYFSVIGFALHAVFSLAKLADLEGGDY